MNTENVMTSDEIDALLAPKATLDDLLLEWACELRILGNRDNPKTLRWKLVIGNKEYAPCFVGYGLTVQETVDDVMRQVAELKAKIEASESALTTLEHK